MVTYKVDEILESVVVTTSADRFIQHSIPLGGNSTWQSSEWKTKSNSLLGKCFSMEIKKTLASLKIASLEFKSRMNAYVFLHHPGQFYDFSSNTKVCQSRLQVVEAAFQDYKDSSDSRTPRNSEFTQHDAFTRYVCFRRSLFNLEGVSKFTSATTSTPIPLRTTRSSPAEPPWTLTLITASPGELTRGC